jgi:hypothetical protein
MCEICDKLIDLTRNENGLDVTRKDVLCGAMMGYYRCHKALREIVIKLMEKGISEKDIPKPELIFYYFVDVMNDTETANGVTLLDRFVDTLIDGIKCGMSRDELN